MSHVVAVEIEIKDLDCLFLAAQECGLDVKLNQRTHRWWGRHVGDYPVPEGFTLDDMGKCEHALAVKGNPQAYEVGVARKGKGYALLYDFFGTHGRALEACIGSRGEKLTQAYAEQVARKKVKKLQRAGYKLRRSVTEAGEVKLTLTK
jgi:hypothetical protein